MVQRGCKPDQLKRRQEERNGGLGGEVGSTSLGVVQAGAGARAAEVEGVGGGPLSPAFNFSNHRMTICHIYTFYIILEFLI